MAGKQERNIEVLREFAVGEDVLSVTAIEDAASHLQPNAKNRAIYCPILGLQRGLWLFSIKGDDTRDKTEIDRDSLSKELRKVWPDSPAGAVRIFTLLDEMPLRTDGQPDDQLLAFYALDLDSRLEQGWP